MLSRAQNEVLTRVDPGTPCGELMRRYWHPVYPAGVPVDDTTTWHMQYFCYVFPSEVEAPAQNNVPYVEVPFKNDKGEYRLDYVLAQDIVTWIEQGEIVDREQEYLGATDNLVTTYRKMLKQQIDMVQAGSEPMNVFRDPALIERPDLRIPGNNEVAARPTDATRATSATRELPQAIPRRLALHRRRRRSVLPRSRSDRRAVPQDRRGARSARASHLISL